MRWALGVVARLVLATTAQAQPRDAPRSIAVVAYPTSGLLEADRRELEDGAASGLRAAGARAPRTPERAGGAERAAAKLAAADQALAAARDQVASFELDAALAGLRRAEAIYRGYLPHLVERDGAPTALFHTYRLIAIAHFLAGDDQAARDTLARCFVLKPTLEYTGELFPPQMEAFVIEARLWVDEMGTGTIEVTARGGGAATVWVNGGEIGPAPQRVDDLPYGPNIVHLVADGAPPVSQVVELEGGAVAAVALDVPSADVAVPRPLLDARGDVGRATASKALRRGAAALGGDAVAVVVATVAGDELSVQVWLYDLRTGRLAASAQVSGPVADAARLGEQAGGAAWASADWSAVARRRAARAPWWEHEYFWPAVGATAGVVLTGVVIGVVASRRRLSDEKKVVVFGLGTSF